MAKTAPADKPEPDDVAAARLEAAGHPDGAPAEIGPDGEPVIEAEIIGDSGATGREVAQRSIPDIEPRELMARNHPAMVQLNTWLEGNLTADSEADLAVADIIAQVLSADSVDEVLGDTEVIGLQSMMDEPLTVYGLKFQRSDYEQGAPYYAVIDVYRGRSQWRGPVTTGAQTILAQLVRLQQLDAWPVTLVCTKATKKPTKGGYWPLKLSVVPTVATG